MEAVQVPQTVPVTVFSPVARPEMLTASLISQVGTVMNDLSLLTRPGSHGAENRGWAASEYAAEPARRSSKKLRQEVLVQQEDREIQIKLDRRSARLDPRARMRMVLAQAQQQGVALTYPQIASAARVSRSTVQRHIKTLLREFEEGSLPETVVLDESNVEPFLSSHEGEKDALVETVNIER